MVYAERQRYPRLYQGEKEANKRRKGSNWVIFALFALLIVTVGILFKPDYLADSTRSYQAPWLHPAETQGERLEERWKEASNYSSPSPLSAEAFR